MEIKPFILKEFENVKKNPFTGVINSQTLKDSKGIEDILESNSSNKNKNSSQNGGGGDNFDIEFSRPEDLLYNILVKKDFNENIDLWELKPRYAALSSIFKGGLANKALNLQIEKSPNKIEKFEILDKLIKSYNSLSEVSNNHESIRGFSNLKQSLEDSIFDLCDKSGYIWNKKKTKNDDISELSNILKFKSKKTKIWNIDERLDYISQELNSNKYQNLDIDQISNFENFLIDLKELKNKQERKLNSKKNKNGKLVEEARKRINNSITQIKNLEKKLETEIKHTSDNFYIIEDYNLGKGELLEAKAYLDINNMKRVYSTIIGKIPENDLKIKGAIYGLVSNIFGIPISKPYETIINDLKTSLTSRTKEADYLEFANNLLQKGDLLDSSLNNFYKWGIQGEIFSRKGISIGEISKNRLSKIIKPKTSLESEIMEIFKNKVASEIKVAEDFSHYHPMIRGLLDLVGTNVFEEEVIFSENDNNQKNSHKIYSQRFVKHVKEGLEIIRDTFNSEPIFNKNRFNEILRKVENISQPYKRKAIF